MKTKDLIKLDFEKARDEYNGLDWDDKEEMENITNIYVKKEDTTVEGYNYSVFLEINNTEIVPYLEHDLKEFHVEQWT